MLWVHGALCDDMFVKIHKIQIFVTSTKEEQILEDLTEFQEN